MAEVEQDIKPPETPIDSRYRRYLAVIISLVAVLAAACAAASAYDDNRADTKHREAQRLSVAGMAESAIGLARFQDENSRQSLRTGAVVRDELTRTAEITLGRGLGAPFDVGATLDGLVGTAPEPDLLPSARERLERATSSGRPGNERFLAAQTVKETAESWSSKSDDYFMAVTLLAVVLTMLGLASTIGGQYRRWFHWPAGVIFLVAAVVAGGAHLTRVAETPSDAVRAVADGDAKVASRDFRGAVADYDRALAQRGDFALAWRQRGFAVVSAGSVGAQVNPTLIGDSTEAAYREGAHDLDRAIELGLDDPGTLGSQGAFRFHLADYEQARELTEQALGEGGESAVFLANLGLILTAEGRAAEAAAAYARFVGAVDPRAATDIRVPAEQYAVAITTLEKVVVLTPEREPLVRQMQGGLAEAWASSQARARVSADVDARVALDLTSTPTGLAVRISPSALDRGASLALITSYRPDSGSGWAVRSDLSRTGTWNFGPDEARVLTLPDAFCLGAGTFRADAFSGGRRLATASVRSLATGAAAAFSEPQSGVRGCRPTAWTPVRETYGVAHYRGPAGAELEVRSIPLDLVGPVGDTAVLTDQASARLAGRAGLAPGPGEPATLMGGAGVARAGPGGVSTWVGTVGATMVTIVMRGDPAETAPVWESLDAATG